MKHKHYDLIVAWAAGAKIEVYATTGWVEQEYPSWHPAKEYRIRPEPLVRYANVQLKGKKPSLVQGVSTDNRKVDDNVEYTFDPKTNALLSVKLLEGKLV